MKRDYNKVEAIVMYHDGEGVKFKEVNCDMNDLRYTRPDGVENRYTYDKFGRNVSIIMSHGYIIDNEYDDCGGLIKSSLYNPDSDRYDITTYVNTYDDKDRLVKACIIDDRDECFNQDSFGGEYYLYNDHDDIICHVLTFKKGGALIASYEYDYINNILTIRDIFDDGKKIDMKDVRRLNLIKYRYGIYEVIEN